MPTNIVEPDPDATAVSPASIGKAFAEYKKIGKEAAKKLGDETFPSSSQA